MTEYTYFGNRGRLQIGDQNVAVLKGIEMTPSYERADLYGQDSIFRQDVARHTAKVEVKIRAAKFDPSISSPTGVFGAYLSALAPSGGTYAGTFQDTNICSTFSVDFWISTDGTTTGQLKATVTNVVFDSLPLPMPENDFVVLDLTGVGKSVSFSNAAI